MADRDKPSEHTLLTPDGLYHLTYHEFNRLWAAGAIMPCPECSDELPGQIGYHPHPRLTGKRRHITSMLFGLLQEALH